MAHRKSTSGMIVQSSGEGEEKEWDRGAETDKEAERQMERKR